MDVQRDVIEIIATKLKRGAGTITAESKLSEIGFDSFDVVEVVFAIEEKFGIDVPYNANTAAGSLEFETVSQVVAAVEGAIAARRPAA
ncbi:MAG: acyl carrier protein [Alphaproteobacteria bacterium]|nr:acyl carrier protein [Alphaproteobacteria bacterium]